MNVKGMSTMLNPLKRICEFRVQIRNQRPRKPLSIEFQVNRR